MFFSLLSINAQPQFSTRWRKFCFDWIRILLFSKLPRFNFSLADCDVHHLIKFLRTVSCKSPHPYISPQKVISNLVASAQSKLFRWEVKLIPDQISLLLQYAGNVQLSEEALSRRIAIFIGKVLKVPRATTLLFFGII